MILRRKRFNLIVCLIIYLLQVATPPLIFSSFLLEQTKSNSNRLVEPIILCHRSKHSIHNSTSHHTITKQILPPS